MSKINLEEILIESFHNNGIPKPSHSLAEITQKAVKEAMKEACRQTLELAAENAEAEIIYGYEGDDPYAFTKRDSILNIINQIE